MNIDFTPAEIAQLVRLCEAAEMADPVTAAIHLKAARCLQNYKPRELESDPKEASQQWRSPI